MEALLKPVFIVYDLIAKPLAAVLEQVLKAIMSIYDAVTPIISLPFKIIEAVMQVFEAPYAAIFSPIYRPFGGILSDHRLVILSGLLMLGVFILVIRLAHGL